MLTPPLAAANKMVREIVDDFLSEDGEKATRGVRRTTLDLVNWQEAEIARMKEEATWRRKAYDSYHAGELDAGAAVASLIYEKGHVTDADLQALAETGGRDGIVQDTPDRPPVPAR